MQSDDDEPIGNVFVMMVLMFAFVIGVTVALSLTLLPLSFSEKKAIKNFDAKTLLNKKDTWLDE